MNKRRQRLLKLQTELIYAAFTGVMRLPDPALASLTGAALNIASTVGLGKDNDTIKLITEFEEFFSARSPLGSSLKNMILKARPEQLKSIIRGYLVNYVYDWAPEGFVSAPSPGTVKLKPVRMGLAGSGPMLSAIADSYRTQPQCRSLALFNPRADEPWRPNEPSPIDSIHSDFDDFLDSVDVVEVLDLENRFDVIMKLIEAGKHVSLQKPFATDIDQARTIVTAADRAGVILRVNDESFFFEPYLKLKQMLDEMEIGEISTIRIKSNLCGNGGFGPLPHLLDSDDFLFHPAFDKFSLAIMLLGDIESVSCLSNPMDLKKGGQALVGFKYKYPGRYGVMELCFSPLASIPTSGLPCDDVIEVAGTDGIIWVNHFHGKMTEDPWIEVRRGKRYYSFGIGSDMAVRWTDALSASALHFLESVSAGKTPILSGSQALSGLKFLLAAKQSAVSGHEVNV